MSAQDYASLCDAVSGRALGELGQTLGAAMAVQFPFVQITTNNRVANFMAQTAEETGGYRWLVELGSEAYFAKYDGRTDLGNSQPGDGFKYRGRGLAMLTGRYNYGRYGPMVKLDLINNPDLAADPTNAVAIACAYWADHTLNPLADANDVTEITRRWNGGLNGLSQRRAYLTTAATWLAAHPISPAQPGVTAVPIDPLATLIPNTGSNYAIPMQEPSSSLNIPPPPPPVTLPTIPKAPAVVKQAPAVAATATGVGALTLIGQQALTSVNFSGLVDKDWPILFAGVLAPLAVYAITRALQLMHFNSTPAIQDVVARGVALAGADIQAYADAHPNVDVKNAQVAAAMNYVVAAIPSKLAQAGISQTQLYNLTQAKIAQLKG